MPHQMSVEEQQELGRRYYKLKQFEKAVEIFSQALNVAPSVSLYDHRAAAYDKLKDYNAAVKDGREMIKLDKKDVRGYLRTASVLEKLEKADIALGIYKYGMKNVPVDDKNFKVLQQLHDKMTRKLSPVKSIDPLTVLPVELAEMVLDHLNFRYIVSAMRVSRGWRDYLAKLPRLWMHLDMSGARRPVPRSFVDKAVRRSRNGLTKITVHRFEHFDVIVNIAKACRELAELDIVSLPHAMSSTLIRIVQNARSLKKLVIRPEITIYTVAQVLGHQTTLEYAAFPAVQNTRMPRTWKGPFPDLHTLVLQISDLSERDHLALNTTNDASFPHLPSMAPALRSLSLSNMMLSSSSASFSSLPLTNLVLKRVCYSNNTRLPSTLESLMVEMETPFRNPTWFPNWPASHLNNLKSLHLANVEGLSADYMDEVLDTYVEPGQDGEPPDPLPRRLDPQPLESLSLHGTLLNPQDGLFKDENSVCGRSPRILTPALKSLDISMLPCNDDEIEYLLQHKLGLTAIDISSTQITGASIKMLADKLPTLQSIRADNCPKISGRDAIEYAMRKGIRISCSMIEPKGSRKIRY